MIEITVKGVTVGVTPETVRKRMERKIIHRVIYTRYDVIAEKLGYPAEAVLITLLDFGTMSTRVELVKGKLPFEFVSHIDSEEDMTRKFTKFIDDAPVNLIDKIIETINRVDEPDDPDLVDGELPPGTEKKS